MEIFHMRGKLQYVLDDFVLCKLQSFSPCVRSVALNQSR